MNISIQGDIPITPQDLNNPKTTLISLIKS